MEQQLSSTLAHQGSDRSREPVIEQGSLQSTLQMRGSGAVELLKRGLDLVLGTCFLLLAIPLIAIVSIFVAMDGGPVFFRHQRVGRGGKMFGCWKFRTMIVDAEASLTEYLALHPEAEAEWRRDQKLVFDPRITPIGTFLRKTSLDELPQLFNVIIGEMSLVGPRPVTQCELSRYGCKARIYASVRPGITGLWQVSGRNDTSYDERVSLDERYVANCHIGADLIILWQTVAVVLSKRGAR